MTRLAWPIVGLGVLLLGGCPPETTEPTEDTDTTVEIPPCADGLAQTAFQTEGAGLWWGDRAGDFSLTLLDGSTWTLSEQWTGCDNYVILSHLPADGASEAVFKSNAGLLLDTSENVHYLFVSDDVDPAARTAVMEDLKGRLDSAVGFLPADERDSWEGRLHFATDKLTAEDGGALSEMLRDFNAWNINPDNRADLGERGKIRAPRPVAIGIDRLQRWDPGGSMAEYVSGPQTFKLASYLGPFYDHRLHVKTEVESTPADEVVLIEETVTERILTRTVDLPADRSAHDTLEFDVLVDCKERNPFMCSEWDRIARVEVCLDGEDCADRRELIRWITPYWRRGERRWLIDASPLLALLRDRDRATFRIEHGPGFERKTVRDLRIAARFRTRGDAPRSVGAERAFTGGNFGAAYNDRTPFTFTPPASATRVELVTILSGHGQTDRDNCAEWCDHRHQFAINGTDLPEIASDPGIGSTAGCGPMAARGVSPGQWGNWAPQRAYWCPGLPVDAERMDITEHVSLGAENSLTYAGVFKGGEPRGGSIALSAYVVWYE